MIIDAHQHFWHYDPVRDAWIDDTMSVLQRDFLPEDLQPIYEAQGIDACVAIQADQSEAETDFLVKLAEIYDFIKGVVGWIDLRSPQLAERLAHYAQIPQVKGFRHIVQAEADPNFLLREDFQRGIAQLSRYNFTYDILVFPHQLGAVLEFVRQFPEQRLVIDHLAKPYIKDGFYDGWALLMRAIARSPNVYCKISGLLTEADWNNWQYQDCKPYLDLVFEVFGPDRLLYGSDWPVCLLAGKYEAGKQVLERYLTTFSDREQAKVWGQNAVSFYGLDG